MTACAKCGAPLSAAAPTGRPARYCSPTCRRLAQQERRRLIRQLDALEARCIADEFTSGVDLLDVFGRDRAQRLADTRRGIAAVEARLAKLLDEE